MSITEFLLARITEDEALAQSILDRSAPDEWDNPMETGNFWPEEVEFSDRHSPSAVLAGCAAKRAIIELADDTETMDYQIMNEWGGGLDGIKGKFLHALAAVYKDHPDYLPEWSA